MKLYFIRHGQSETNLSKCWTGWLDSKLTENGRNDARVAGDFLKGIRFDKVFASDLLRARTTAELALPDYAIELTPVLREISAGSIEGTPIESVDRSILADGFACFGGETREELSERVRAFLGSVEKLECETVAAFTHGGFIMAVLDEVLGTVLPRKAVKCANCTIAVLEYADGTWMLHSWMPRSPWASATKNWSSIRMPIGSGRNWFGNWTAEVW